MPGHNFKKRFGQNFFKTNNWPNKLVSYADLKVDDIVFEIGPGEGKITEILLNKVKRVIACEIDNDLIPKLQEKFKLNDNFQLLHQDILSIKSEYFNDLENYKVIGSLPYNISKKIIKYFLETKNPPEIMLTVMQKEVAQDYVAQAPRASFLSNYLHILSQVTYLATIPRQAFYPIPQVDGAVLRIEQIDAKFPEAAKLIKFIKYGFTSPRKTLSNNLKPLIKDSSAILTAILKLGLSQNARASELQLDLWYKLYQELKNKLIIHV